MSMETDDMFLHDQHLLSPVSSAGSISASQGSCVGDGHMYDLPTPSVVVAGQEEGLVKAQKLESSAFEPVASVIRGRRASTASECSISTSGSPSLFFLASICSTLVENPNSNLSMFQNNAAAELQLLHNNQVDSSLSEFKKRSSKNRNNNNNNGKPSSHQRKSTASASSWTSQVDNNSSNNNNDSGADHLVCYICEAAFSSNHELVEHAIEHVHGTAAQGNTGPINAAKRIKQCPVCAKVFSNNTQLVTHLRVHTKERPYSCDQCGKSFTQKSTLNRHTRVHTGERPFRCQLCFKSFAQKSTLAAHMTTHTGGKSPTEMDSTMELDQESSFAPFMKQKVVPDGFRSISSNGSEIMDLDEDRYESIGEKSELSQMPVYNNSNNHNIRSVHVPIVSYAQAGTMNSTGYSMDESPEGM